MAPCVSRVCICIAINGPRRVQPHAATAPTNTITAKIGASPTQPAISAKSANARSEPAEPIFGRRFCIGSPDQKVFLAELNALSAQNVVSSHNVEVEVRDRPLVHIVEAGELQFHVRNLDRDFAGLRTLKLLWLVAFDNRQHALDSRL